MVAGIILINKVALTIKLECKYFEVKKWSLFLKKQ